MDTDFDIAPTAAQFAIPTVAMRLFLQDGRFQDWRSEPHLVALPISFGNCAAAAIMLASALSELDPSGLWRAVDGSATDNTAAFPVVCLHSFVVSDVHELLADVSGDQFGAAAVVLRLRADLPSYHVSRRALTLSLPHVVERVTKLRHEWAEVGCAYQAAAAIVVDRGQAMRLGLG